MFIILLFYYLLLLWVKAEGAVEVFKDSRNNIGLRLLKTRIIITMIIIIMILKYARTRYGSRLRVWLRSLQIGATTMDSIF
jgi:hypothetical protein